MLLRQPARRRSRGTFRHEAESRGLAFEVQLDPTLGRSHRHRREAPAAGAQEPAVERVQVHRAGRRAPARHGGAERLDRRTTRSSSQAAERGRVRGHRHRHRHPAREAAHHLRGVPAGRRRHQPQVRRHRPRPRDQPRAREPARRRDPAAQHAGLGSTFTLYLPLRYVGLPLGDRAAEARRRGRAVAAAGSGARRRSAPPSRSPTIATTSRRATPMLLIVEDDPHYARVLVDLARDNGLQGAGRRRAAPRRSTLAREFTPDGGLARRLPARHARLDRAQPAQAGPGARATSRCRSSRSTRTASTASRAARSRSSPSRPPPRASTTRSTRIKEYAAPRRKRLLVVEDNAAERIEHQRAARPRRHRHRRPSAPAREALDALREQPLRLRGARPAAARHVGLRGARAASRDDDALRDLPVVVFTGKELSPDEDAQLHTLARSVVVKGVESPERLLDETALFLHRVVADLPAEKQQMLERLHRSDEDLVGQDGAGGRRRRAQHLRALERARAARHEGADRQHRPRGDRARSRRTPRHRDRADGHHDAGDGRLRDHAARSASDPRSGGCRSSRSPPRR